MAARATLGSRSRLRPSRGILMPEERWTPNAHELKKDGDGAMGTKRCPTQQRSGQSELSRALQGIADDNDCPCQVRARVCAHRCGPQVCLASLSNSEKLGNVRLNSCCGRGGQCLMYPSINCEVLFKIWCQRNGKQCLVQRCPTRTHAPPSAKAQANANNWIADRPYCCCGGARVRACPPANFTELISWERSTPLGARHALLDRFAFTAAPDLKSCMHASMHAHANARKHPACECDCASVRARAHSHAYTRTQTRVYFLFFTPTCADVCICFFLPRGLRMHHVHL